MVARAAGPRHRRPRLRHEAHRRGAASAASRPPQARARADGSVRQSAQRSADRSVQPADTDAARLDCPRLALGCQATFRPPSARQRARTAAAPCLTSSPPKGAPRKAPAPLRSARAMDASRPLTPAGGSADRCAPACRRLCRPPGVSCHRPVALCGLSSLLASVRNVMPEGSCVKARPRCAHQQDGHRGLAASEGGGRAGGPRCWRTTVAGSWAGGELTRVPDAVLAWAGGRVGQRAPPPLAGRCAPWLDERSFTGRAVCCRAPGAGPCSSPDRQPWRRGTSSVRPAPGSRTRLPIAAAFFFLLKTRKVIPAGPRQGQGPLRSVRQRTLDMALSARIGAAREGGRKQKCRSNRPLRGQGPYRMFYSPPPRQERAVRGSTGTRRCTAAAHSPQKNSWKKTFLSPAKQPPRPHPPRSQDVPERSLP